MIISLRKIWDGFLRANHRRLLENIKFNINLKTKIMSTKQQLLVVSVIFGTVALTLWIVSFIYKINIIIPSVFQIWQFVFLALSFRAKD